MEDTPDTPSIRQIALFGEMKFYRVHPSTMTRTPITVRFKTSKARLLLAYLLLHPNQPHNREFLAALFWPENEETGRDRLRDALSSIRSALREAEISDEMLLTTNSTVRVTVPDDFQTDVAAFDQALLRAESHRPDQGDNEHIAALEEAVALYAGPLLHADVDIKDAEEWIAPLRTRYSLLFDDILSQLTMLYTAQDDVKRALFYARRSAENNPAEPEPAEMVRVLSERLQQMERANVTRLLGKREILPVTAAETVFPAPAPAPMEPTLAPVASAHASAPNPPPASSDAQSAPLARKGRPFRRSRRLFAGSAVSVALLGVLGGIYITRMRVPTKPPVMTPNQYDATLSLYLRELTGTTSHHGRLDIAIKIRELGKNAHYRDQVKGLSLVALEKALIIFQEEKDTWNVVDTLITLAIVTLLRGERPQAIQYIEKASRTLAPLERGIAKADDLQAIAEWAIDAGEYNLVQANLDTSLKIAQRGTSERHRLRVAFVLWNQGCYDSDMGNYTAAKQHLREAADRLTAFKDQAETRAAVLGNLGETYAREGDAAQAEAYYQEGLVVWEQKKHPAWVAIFKTRLAALSLARAEAIGISTRTQPADTAAGAKALEEAEKLCRDSLILLEDSNNPVACAGPQLVLGRVLHYQGKPETAYKLLNEGVDTRKQVGNPLRVAEALEILALYESQTGNFISGRKHAQEAGDWRKKAGTSIIPPCDQAKLAGMRATLGLPPLK